MSQSNSTVSLADILEVAIKREPMEFSPAAKSLLNSAKDHNINVSATTERILGTQRVEIVFAGIGDYKKFKDGGFIEKLHELMPQCRTVHAGISPAEPQFMGWHGLHTLDQPEM